MIKHSHGGRPQLLHDRIPMLISFERDRLKEFEQECKKANMSISEGIRQLIENELEKKAEGDPENPNPLNLPISTYSLVDAANKPLSKAHPIETLDYFLYNGLYTSKVWDPVFKNIDDKDKMQKLENLTTIMHQAAKSRNSYLKTGRVQVTHGHGMQVPTMKDM